MANGTVNGIDPDDLEPLRPSGAAAAWFPGVSRSGLIPPSHVPGRRSWASADPALGNYANYAANYHVIWFSG